MTESQEGLLERIGRDVKVILRFAGPLTLLPLAAWLFGGPEIVSKGTAMRVDLLTVLYPLGAAASGALFGIFEPVADRSRIASMGVGVLSSIPWVVGVSLTMERGYSDWTLAHTIISAGMSLVFGGAFGYGYSQNPLSEEHDSVH